MTLIKKFCYSLGCLLPMLLTQAQVCAQPSVISATPSSGQGFTQTFAFAVAASGGWANLNSVQVNFSAPLSGPNSCFVGYDVAGHVIALLDDAGASWTSSVIGTAGAFLRNSQCSVDSGASSVSTSGNNLTLTLAITFTSSFAGTKTIYMNAKVGTVDSGWMPEGTWTVGSPTVPSAVSATPSAGTGLTQTFSFVFSDTGGFANLYWAQVVINSTLNGFHACYFSYNRGPNAIGLDGDNNTWPNPVTVGSGGLLSNSQCTVDATASSFSVSGNNLTLNVAITFSPSFAGTKNIYMIAADNNGITSDWLPAGTWTVGNPTVPSVVSSTPSSGGGSPQTFTFVYSDTGGWANVNNAQVLFNSSITGANGCYIGYNPAGWIVLRDDAGANWTPSLVLGSSGSVSNSRCTISGPGSSHSGSGNNLTITLAMTFSSLFAGTQTIYMYASDSGSGTQWVPKGTWAAVSGGGAGWYSNGGTWTNRRKITINHGMVSGAANLMNFPALVSITDPELKSVGNGGKVGKNDGTDILFTAADGTTKLNHEIESYSAGTGQLTAWVQIPALSPTADTVLDIYYGNTPAADQQNKSAVWDANYKGVWHLSEDPASSAPQFKDSTPNAYHLTTATQGSAVMVTGKIGGGVNFPTASPYSGSYASNSAALGIGGTNNYTVSGWFKLNSQIGHDGGIAGLFGTGAGNPNYFVIEVAL